MSHPKEHGPLTRAAVEKSLQQIADGDVVNLDDPKKEFSPRIVIGSGRFDPKSDDARRHGPQDSLVPGLVLAHTIREHCPDAEIIDTWALERPQMKVHANPTPFSVVRFHVPKYMGGEGWAIYLDADMIVFDDITKLWDCIPSPIESDSPKILCTEPSHSVCLINCEALAHWDGYKIAADVDSGKLRYGILHGSMNGAYRTGQDSALPPEWNHLDRFTRGETRLLHFTNLRSQPWTFPGKHHLEGLWVDALNRALAAGAVQHDQLSHVMFSMLGKVRA